MWSSPLYYSVFLALQCNPFRAHYNVFFRALPMECTIWHDKKRKSLQVGQIVILVPLKNQADNHDISKAKVCRISRKMKRKYRHHIEYIFRYQEIDIENGILKGTGSNILNNNNILNII